MRHKVNALGNHHRKDCKVLFRIGVNNKPVGIKICGYPELKGALPKLEWLSGIKRNGRFIIIVIDPNKPPRIFPGIPGGHFVGSRLDKEFLNPIFTTLKNNRWRVKHPYRRNKQFNRYILGVRYKGEHDLFSQQISELIQKIPLDLETIIGTRGLIVPHTYYLRDFRNKNFDLIITPKNFLDASTKR